MQSLQAHMEDMRSLTLCKICLRPFYEPFILGCGHSFCYSCLRSWFGAPADRKKNRNCPDCRTEVKAEPAPNYLLREISHLFINRAELLPEDESIAEHVKDLNEESDLLSKDKKSAGLFQGRFKSPLHATFHHGVIHDFEDGVQRCPHCAWELEEGQCNRCGWTIRDFDDLSGSEDDMSFESEEDDESLPDSDENIHDDLVGPQHTHFHAIDIESDDEDEDEDDNGSEINAYDRHDDFVDDEDEVDMDDVDETRDYDNYLAEPGTPYSDAESEDEYAFGGNVIQQNIPRRHAHVIHDSDEESEAANSGIYANSVRPFSSETRGRSQIVISDGEDEEQEPQTELTTSSQADIQQDSAEEDENDSDDEDSSSESDSESVESASESSSDSSDATVEDNRPNEDDQAAEESDDTVIPPQPKRIRQNRLRDRRDIRDRRSISNNTQMAVNSNAPGGRLHVSHVHGQARNNRRGRLTSVY